MKGIFLGFLVIGTLLASCKSGPFNLIKPASPHQAYERKLISAGLDRTVMGSAWINKAQQSLQEGLPISLPYQERGYFAPDRIEAAVFNVNLQRGQQLNIKLDRKPSERFKVYVDLHESADDAIPKLIASADTLGNPLKIAINKTGVYTVRLQPELLSSGEYTLSLTTGPSLNFPLKAGRANQIQSIFGDGRDGNTRKHEGIDIFAPFRTPVIAVAKGRVTAVNENKLGGKVVWLRPEGKDFTLYYAHLDEQTVGIGDQVNYGDTLGRMGNTGNAKTTPPHLHFGIYTNGGAVDPFPFVNPVTAVPSQISVTTAVLNTGMRTVSKVNPLNLEKDVLVRISAASENRYRIELPDGSSGYVLGKQLEGTAKPIKNFKIDARQLELFEEPDSSAAVKLTLKKGDNVEVLGNFGDFQFIKMEKQLSGWIKK